MGRLTIAIALMLAAIGCGGAPDPAGEAASSLVDAGSSRVSIVFDYGEMQVRAEGEADFARGRARYTYGVSGASREHLDRTTTEIRVLDGRGYAHLPEGMPFAKAANKRWSAWEYAQPSSAVAGLVLEQGFLADPRRLVALLRARGVDARAHGRGFVRDVDTTRYDLTIDLRTAAADATGADADALATMLEYDESPVLRAQLWVGDDDLVRRLVLINKDDDTTAVRGTTTYEFFDFGLPVHVEAPPAEEVLTDEDWEKLVGDCDDGERTGGDGSETHEDDDGHRVVLCVSSGSVVGRGYGTFSNEQFPLDVTQHRGLKDADQDGDGKLTQAEVDAWAETQAGGEAFPWDVEGDPEFAAADANDDGQVTKAEWDAFPELPIAVANDAILREVDANRDGVVSEDELDDWYETESEEDK